MKRNTIIIITAIFLFTAAIVQSCISTKVTDKSGSQLWTENCRRCHNSPPSSAFNNTQWEVINTHMRQRAMLNEDEYIKVLGFMQGE